MTPRIAASAVIFHAPHTHSHCQFSRELRYGSFSAVMLFLLNLLLMEIYAPLNGCGNNTLLT